MLRRLINYALISIIYAKRGKIEVFGHFIELGWFDWSDITYNDSTNCFSTFDKGYRSCIIN